MCFGSNSAPKMNEQKCHAILATLVIFLNLKPVRFDIIGWMRSPGHATTLRVIML
jgi:hypothetical protein